LTRWDVKNGPAMRNGSRIDMRMAVGSAQVGSLIEVVEFDAPADMAWTSVTGIDQRGRWRLRELGPDRTKITLRLAYQAPGGLVGGSAGVNSFIIEAGEQRCHVFGRQQREVDGEDDGDVGVRHFGQTSGNGGHRTAAG